LVQAVIEEPEWAREILADLGSENASTATDGC
jgi:hypothetical protein